MELLKLVILEGCSGAGKSTLMHPIHQLSNYQDLLVHRFTPTNWVYDHLNSRRNVDYEEINRELQAIFDVHVIWCDCSSIVAHKRQIEKKDLMIEDLASARMLFREYFENVSSFENVIYLPTDQLTIEESVEIISKRIYGSA